MIRTYIFSTLVSSILSLIMCAILIPVLKKVGIGQNILSYVKEHKKKSGTPTMGGISFIFAAVIAAFLFIKKPTRVFIITIVIGLSYLLVGFLDDLLKKRHHDNLGLTALQKLIFQAFVAIFAGVYVYKSGVNYLYIPFTKKKITLGFYIIPLCVFVFLAMVNCVNLTDGLDGLAAGVSLPFFLFLGIILILEGMQSELSMIAFCVFGAVSSYLIFNISKASIFMGDTGSLALGGFASCIATFSGNALYIAVLGIAFAFSGITVIIQVIYYKVTGGKRVFLMAPIHHHFQKKGYSECKISYVYAFITSVIGMLCLLPFVA